MKHYCSRIAVKPTVFTEDTVYQMWINMDAHSVRIFKMHIQLDSADAGGTFNSVYGWQRTTGVPVDAGADVIVATKFDNNMEPSKVAIMRDNAGIDMTGVTRQEYFLERSIVSKTTGSASTVDFNHLEGFLLLPGEGLCIFADNTVHDGSGVYGMLEWGEE